MSETMDSKSFLGIGWKFPVSYDENGRIKTSKYEQNIQESILIILKTKKGERIMRPDFGCSIHDFVFESTNVLILGEIKLSIVKALTDYEPRIELINIDISLDKVNSGILLINIFYRVITTNNRFNLVYPFFIKEG